MSRVSLQSIVRSLFAAEATARRTLRAAVVALLAVGVVFAATIAVAGAAGTLPFLGSFGNQGTAGGGFKAPRGVAVDGSNGSSRSDVYVTDQGNQRVEKFNAVGGFILTFGSHVNETKVNEKAEGKVVTEAEQNVCTAASRDACTAGVQGEAGGQFSNPLGVAVDPTSGDVYVADFSNHRVEKFGPAGEFLLAIGREVDATTSANVCTAASGDICQAGKAGIGEAEFEWAVGSFIAVGATGTLYVGDQNRVQEFSSAGARTGEVALPGAGKTTSLAVDSSGNMYAVSQGLSGVREYSATGTELADFDPERESGELKAVAVQPASGDLFLIDTNGGVRVRQYAPTGALSAESEGGLLEASNGLAVNAAGTAYVADSADEASADKVLFFGAPPSEGNPPPAIDAESAAELGEESATLEARINPFFLEARYRVQYVPAAGYNPSAADPYAAPGGGEAPSASGIVLGGGAMIGDEPARVTVVGLLSGAEYHYRFVAESSAGPTYGPDRTFTTFQPGGVAGLPDSRVYEQVSPQKKNGNEDGAGFAAASFDGNRVAYQQEGAGGGPVGETSSGADFYSVSRRNAVTGWETSAALPPTHLANVDILGQEALVFLPSADLSRFLFVATGPFAAENSSTSADENLGLYRTTGNTSEPEWLSRPTFPSFSEAKPEPGKIATEGVYPVGGSTDLSTAYFTYFGTLVPADASRAPFVKPQPETSGPWGFYESKAGKLSSAGELPDGSHGPFGAVPAVTGESTGGVLRTPFRRFLLNEVSEDGSKAFFVSPDPSHASEAGTPTELYVREQTAGAPRTALVSRDELNGGSPAAGSGAETAVTPLHTQYAPNAYVYASPDGSRAFFESMDKLARSAAGAEPEGAGPWTYQFNVDSEKATYLPGVVGPIAASSQDGSSFLFENTSTGKIELWTGGPAPIEVASFPAPGNPEFEGAAARDGAVFAFNTNAVLKRGSQTFNNSAAVKQSYRYDASAQRLSCVSCTTAGSPQSPIVETGVAREIADEGQRLFFATAAKLVGRDVNGVEDVYEWEQPGTGSCRAEEHEGGCLYLISSGSDPSPSFYLENDESGENVFFATRQGLAKGDTDESYDVYDARANGGFPQEVAPAECAAACRPPGVAPALAAPLTTALEPSGNLLAPVESTQPPTPRPATLTRAQKLARALRACRTRPKRRRAACVRNAERLYGKPAKAKSRRAGGR